MRRGSELPTQVGFMVDAGTVFAVVRGELDFATNHRLHPAIAEATSRRLDLAVDLRDVPFMDSHTAKLFARTAEDLRLCGRTLRIIDAQPVVQRLLVILALDYLLADAQRR